MPLPTLAKTWQFSVNNTVAANTDTSTTHRDIIFKIKQQLVAFGTNPWTVVSSSSGTGTFGASDLWATAANVIGATPGTNHSWIRLRQTGIATNFELCIDMTSSALQNATIVMSPSAGFTTGGTATARPTASDEIVLINATTWSSSTFLQHQVHLMQSTDGQCTRVFVFANNTASTFWVFDKPANPTSGWTNPSCTVVTAGGPTLSSLDTIRGKISSTVTMAATMEAAIAGAALLYNLTGIGTVQGDIDVGWPMFPIGFYTSAAPNRGRHGTFFDLWIKPTGVLQGDSFPNNAATRQFMAIGSWVFPWTGSTDTLLII